MRDTHGHDWFGRVCRRCGTTSDRHNAVRRCEPPPVDQSVFTPADAATFVSAFDTSSYDSTPAPAADISTPDTSFDGGFSGGESGGGGGGADF